MSSKHHYSVNIKWTGNKGSGTENYKNYNRDFNLAVQGKTDILGSADSAFLGNKTKHNPEDFLVSAVSSCHMLWYLHLCAESGVIVTDYRDCARGIMEENGIEGGKFTEITLNPVVIVTDKKMIEKASELHSKANELCFIANSLNFKISHNAVIKAEER